MVDMELVDFAEFLAFEARKKIVPHFRKKIEIDEKSDKSPVTIADRQAEEEIRKLISMNHPEHGVLGEEFGDHNLDAEYVWVIDPIDGTKSFILGRPIFGTLIALLHNGRPIVGVIDQPILEQTWLAYDAEVKFRGKEEASDINTRNCSKLSDALFACTSLEMFSEDEKPIVEKIHNECKQSVFGGDCYNYAALAEGAVDVIIESDMKPYDFMALVPIIKNAGGEITDWQGSDLGLNSNGQILACGDKSLHKKILEDYLL